MTGPKTFTGEVEELQGTGIEAADCDLALTNMPLLRLDRAEPYRPLAMGYTVFRAAGQSPSSKFLVEPWFATTIEYAVWYDWDIQHLYDLEHVWVHLDHSGDVAAVEASYHGKRIEMAVTDGMPEMAGARPVLYAEPGKHAHWADPTLMREVAGAQIRAMCGVLAGHEGVHLGNPFANKGEITATGADHRLARLKMLGDAILPAFDFSRPGKEEVALVPWPILEAWIPVRVGKLIRDLEGTTRHIKAVLLDCGDTLIDEGTEEKRPGTDIALRGELIAGAQEMLFALQDRGYRLALVADGPPETFENLLKPKGLWDFFEAHVISGEVGERKPSPKMFASALEQLNIDRSDASAVVMVGNNLSRDIKGANMFGLRSVFFAWSDRRTHQHADPSEKPDYTIRSLDELPPLLDLIEQQEARTAARGQAVGEVA